MKKTLIIGLAMVLAGVAGAQTTNNYTVTPAIGIPDGNPVGLTEQFTVSGVGAPISDVEFSLNVAGGFNGDLYAYLVGPQGQMAVLLNRAGVGSGNALGYGAAVGATLSGLNVVFDDGAVNGNIHGYGAVGTPVGNVWAPDGRAVDPQSAGSVFDAASTGADLSLFNGTAANGVWTFFIADMSSGGGTATLSSATLSIITVPEPGTMAMLGLGAVGFVIVNRLGRNRTGK